LFKLLAYGINSALKNVGSTVLLRERHRNQRDNSILQLAGDIVGGRIKQRFHTRRESRVQRTALVGVRFNSKTWVDWPELQKKVPDVIRLGYYEDENVRAFSLESARITFPRIVGRCAQLRRALLAIQPMILPAFRRVLRA
jgi:hypothetical protein